MLANAAILNDLCSLSPVVDAFPQIQGSTLGSRSNGEHSGALVIHAAPFVRGVDLGPRYLRGKSFDYPHVTGGLNVTEG
jgi:hypothetical protein